MAVVPAEPGQPFHTSITQSLIEPAEVAIYKRFAVAGATNFSQVSALLPDLPTESEHKALGPLLDTPDVTKVETQAACEVATAMVGADAQSSPTPPVLNT